MNERDRFYQARDRRTIEYGVPDVFETPVGIIVGPQAARSVRGQLATLALVNMLARIHRRLCLRVPEVPLLRPALVSAERLDEAAFQLARKIDPFIHLSDDCEHVTATIGLGADAPSGLRWYVGSDGQVAMLDRSPISIDEIETPSLGGCLAACLGAAAALRMALEFPVRPARVSAWTLSEDTDAVRGPELTGPLHVGDVLQVGAGGVGSCVAYWLREFGLRGDWSVLDGDLGELHNTNRCLGMFPCHTGWPEGSPNNKAAVAASLIGAESIEAWYDAFDHNARSFDLILPLANERTVRHQIACRGEPLLLHATTSPLWEAQLHRHIPDRDDCITCRMPRDSSEVRMKCSTVRLPHSHGPSTDAALPFLSAAAGLLLLAGLFRLQEGDLLDGRHNLWGLCFDNPRRFVRRAVHVCETGCGVTLPPTVRRRIHAGRRWSVADTCATETADLTV